MLCLGGTFNPIHNGHLIMARTVAESLSMTKVTLIPSAVPPLKHWNNGLASAEHRFNMCKAAVEDDPLFEVSPVEMDRPQRSYTYDTAVTLKAAYNEPIYWIAGSDVIPTLHTWHRFEELKNVLTFIFVERPGCNVSIYDPKYEPITNKIAMASVNENFGNIEMSSTTLRLRIADRKSIKYLVPEAVEDYIRWNGLY